MSDAAEDAHDATRGNAEGDIRAPISDGGAQGSPPLDGP
jgi:hypothetical protein